MSLASGFIRLKRVNMIKGVFVVATSHTSRRLKKTPLEKKRNEKRILWEARQRAVRARGMMPESEDHPLLATVSNMCPSNWSDFTDEC